MFVNEDYQSTRIASYLSREILKDIINFLKKDYEDNYFEDFIENYEDKSISLKQPKYLAFLRGFERGNFIYENLPDIILKENEDNDGTQGMYYYKIKKNGKLHSKIYIYVDVVEMMQYTNKGKRTINLASILKMFVAPPNNLLSVIAHEFQHFLDQLLFTDPKSKKNTEYIEPDDDSAGYTKQESEIDAEISGLVSFFSRNISAYLLDHKRKINYDAVLKTISEQFNGWKFFNQNEQKRIFKKIIGRINVILDEDEQINGRFNDLLTLINASEWQVKPAKMLLSRRTNTVYIPAMVISNKIDKQSFIRSPQMNDVYNYYKKMANKLKFNLIFSKSLVLTPTNNVDNTIIQTKIVNK